MLVAEGVAELHAAFNELLGRQFPQIAQIDDEHVAQIDVADHGPVFAVVPEQYVAVAQEGVAIQRNGYGLAVTRVLAQPVFLRVPLAEFQQVDFGFGQPIFPRLILDVAEYGFYDVHSIPALNG